MSLLLEVLTPVELIGPRWSGPVSSEVLGVTGDVVTVLTPRSWQGYRLVCFPDERLTISWARRAGSARLDVAVIGPSPDGREWRVEALDDPVLEQRRSSPRVAVARTVHIAWDGELLTASTADIGEGGLRCTTKTTPTLRGLDRVEVRLLLTGELLAVPATVLRSGPGLLGTEIVLSFDELAHEMTKELRRFVLAELARRR